MNLLYSTAIQSCRRELVAQSVQDALVWRTCCFWGKEEAIYILKVSVIFVEGFRCVWWMVKVTV